MTTMKAHTAGHTPGPWKVFHTTDGEQIIGIGRASTGDGVTDPRFGLWCSGDEREANAALIAAAPETAAERDRLKEINADLLAALPNPDQLIALADFLDRHDDNLFGSGVGDRIVQNDLRATAATILAAISRATVTP